MRSCYPNFAIGRSVFGRIVHHLHRTDFNVLIRPCADEWRSYYHAGDIRTNLPGPGGQGVEFREMSSSRYQAADRPPMARQAACWSTSTDVQVEFVAPIGVVGLAIAGLPDGVWKYWLLTAELGLPRLMA